MNIVRRCSILYSPADFTNSTRFDSLKCMQPKKANTNRRRGRMVHPFTEAKYNMGYQTTAQARILIQSQTKRPLTRERRVQALKDAFALEQALGLIVHENDPRISGLVADEEPRTINW